MVFMNKAPTLVILVMHFLGKLDESKMTTLLSNGFKHLLNIIIKEIDMSQSLMENLFKCHLTVILAGWLIILINGFVARQASKTLSVRYSNV